MSLEVPSGYYEVNLSTKGEYGAPKSFHVRNFKPEEALSLSVTDQEDLPIKVGGCLQKLILEPDVDLYAFHEKEVAELCTFIYKTFYNKVLTGLQYLPDKETLEWLLMNKYNGQKSAAYLLELGDLVSGKTPLTCDVDSTTLEYYDIPESPAKVVNIKKPDGFTCKIGYPTFGDVIALKNAVDSVYKEQDKQHASAYRIYKTREDAEKKAEKGEAIDLNSVPYLPETELKKLKQYEVEKTSFILGLTKGIHLLEINGTDVSKASLEDRMKLADDPHIDFPTFQRINEKFKDLPIGIKPILHIEKNPITKEPGTYNHTISVLDILSIIKNFSDNGTEISFGSN